MQIVVRVATAIGWNTYYGDVPDGSDLECYALPKERSRSRFWSDKMGRTIPEGKALVWHKPE